MRIKEHPILEFRKGRKVHFTFEGKTLEGYDDEPIAVSLYAQGVVELSSSLKQHRPRGIFCCIGNCSSCLMKVNGLPNVRTCTKRVEEGMIVELQKWGK
jgi:predicted molibdopterin-dependent oxidoreductase YjgC